MARSVWLALALILVACTARDARPPADAGMSTARLAQLDRMCTDAIAANQIPGAVVLVARHGTIVYHKAFGVADQASGRRLDKDDIFRIASQTKAITATAVMMLWEEARFQLDDPIAKFIPAFAKTGVLDTYDPDTVTWTTVPVKTPITIRHLLTHTSGIGYGAIDGDPRFRAMFAKAGVTDLFTTEPTTIGESVERLATVPLHHQPGEKFSYGEGLDVLAYLVEIVSGKPFDVFLRERLFEPLGMHDTAFYVPDDKAHRLVPVQHRVDDRWVRYPTTFYDPDYPIKGARTFFSGGAGLTSTARDYARFLQMYLNDGAINGVRILSRTTIRTIMREQTGDLWGSPDRSHGLAFGLVTDHAERTGGTGTPGTFTWGGYFNSQYFADPTEGTIGVLLKQTRGSTGDPTPWQFRVLIGAAIDD